MKRRASWTRMAGQSGRLVAAAALAALPVIAGVLAGPRNAGAQSQDARGTGDDDPPGLDCLTDTRGTLSATPQAIHAGGTATLQWSVQAPAGCGAVVVKVDGLTQPRAGTMAVSGIANRSAVLDTHLVTTYTLRAHYGGASRDLASTVVEVYLPVVGNRPTVRITANHQASLLLLALNTPKADIFVENHVVLDLTGRTPIFVAEGVHLKGGRTSREPGGLLFMRPKQVTCTGGGLSHECQIPEKEQFLILRDDAGVNGDNVRISGLRISGTVMHSASNLDPVVHGIVVHSRVNVEIDNNEIFGWRGGAVRVQDNVGRICHVPDATCPVANAATVRIHHNYIHHNQHDGGEGYGVDMMHGAYALIEKNVFDYNRHAIAGGAQPGTGYLAYRNLVLENGGFHDSYLGYDVYTHQFDMHGSDDCDAFLWIDGDQNCGDAGEFMDIAFNSFFYTKDNAFKLRGKPSLGATVRSNVFAHDMLVVGGILDPALGGYIEHMQVEDNLTGINESGNYGRCDFDGDGLEDLFLATGQTWWFNSGGDRHWIYLNTSRKRLSEVTLAGDVDGDRRCDVIVNGTVLSGGTGKPFKNPAEIVWRGGAGEVGIRTMDGGTVVGDTRPGLMDLSWRVAAIADFTADGNPDLLWRASDGRTSVWEMGGGQKLTETYGSAAGEAWSIQGTGDFDGDGGADLLWRDTRGQLAIWFEGRYAARGQTAGADAVPTAYPGYRNLPEPVDLAWTVLGVGDFDGDGRADILWRHTNGQALIWYMAGGLRIGEAYAGTADPTLSMRFQAIADFDNDGRADILWHDVRGGLAIWFGGDAARVGRPSYRNQSGALDPAWRAVKATDFNRDGRADILWQDENTGGLMLWLMAGARFLGEAYPRPPQFGWQLAERVMERTRDTGEAGGDVNDELPVDRRGSRY